ncbi:MAG: biotin/lipoyl-binding protein [Chloroflexi bacterium]|nr:biotin/lipoyl-binding protein [Chloroflexota bacterium]
MAKRPTRAAWLGLLIAGLLPLTACGLPAAAQAPATGQTTTVQRGTVEATINASGAVKAAGDLSLALDSGSLIREVLVKTGDRVTAGQPLLKADPADLQLALQQAEANLASAQAKFEQTKAGATDKELKQAEAAVAASEASYQQTVQGTTTPQDIANAQAALRSAEARLAATVAGTTTPQDLASAEASLRSAEAKLAATVAGTTTPQDLASAEASLRSAEAKLAEVRAGPKPADLDAAVQQLSQARDSRAKQESQLALSKEQARIAVEAAANDLRTAQSRYGAAKLMWDAADRTGKDPAIESCPDANRRCNNLTDAKRRQYKSDFEAAERAMTNAEQALEQKQLAYEDAKKQEIIGLQTAASQVQAAAANLDTVKAGPSAAELATAEATAEQARASLEKLRAPAKEADIIQAQAAVEQARASLDKLRAPAKAADITQAQAAVEQARASLEKLQRPADPGDVTQAQASLASSQAALSDLKAGAKAADVASALAAVKQAEVAQVQARANLTRATLTAPFAGVVAAVNAMPGQLATGSSSSSTSTTTSSGQVTLIDDSTLSIDMNIAEADVAKVKPGQRARATFMALTNQTIPGRVIAVSPKATVTSNVVSYVATMALDGEARLDVKTGMTATVAIIVASKADVLAVPNRLIQGQGQQRSVNVLFKGAQFATPVTIGLVGDSTSEVVNGLAEGDVLVSGAATGSQTTTTRPGAQTKPGGLGNFAVKP